MNLIDVTRQFKTDDDCLDYLEALRWRMPGLVAAVYWAGGVAIFVCNSGRATRDVMLFEMCIVMILFGLYAMWREPKRGGFKGEQA